ncbi:MAG: tRNA (adenosine(37)-N6)-dimethylallyltransferase MiaA [Patescibacteria group bacterium]
MSRDKKRTKVIIVLGPTATGKSDLAVVLAKKFNGDVISADSRQVYRGVDLGSDKITEGEMREIRHYLIDVASPKKKFSVAQYKKLAEKTIKDIWRRGKIPIICGGTGLYIDTLIYDRKLPEVKPNLKLRRNLEKKTAEELFEELKKLDPKRAGNIDRFNKRRLVRALEIVMGTGTPVPPLIFTNILSRKNTKYDVLKIGITVPAEELKIRIKKRTLKRLRGGVIGEMENLRKTGVSDKKLDEVSLYYRWVRPYLRGEINQEKTLELISTKIWQYAKRQMTWFKRDKNILWIKNPREAEKLVTKFLKARETTTS